MAKLIINPTSGAKKEIPVGDRVLSIGRDPSNDLVLSDAMVSRRHAIMESRGDDFVIRDNNSSNGTMVNGDKVVGDQTLRDGDLIAIGSARMLFQIESEQQQSEEPESLKKTPEGVDGIESEPKCPSCGLAAGPADRYCRRCGEEVTAPSPRQAVCGNCSSPVPLPADYCGSCGKPVLTEKSKHHVPTEPRPWEPLPADKPLVKVQEPSTPAASQLARPPGQSEGEDRPVVRPSGRRSKLAKDAPAGFWIRFVAYLIDTIIIVVPMALTSVLSLPAMLASAGGGDTAPSPLFFVLPFVGGGLTFFLAIAYPVYFWSNSGSTPGKSLLGLKVTAMSGACPIGTGQALMRVVGYFINGFTFGIGFLLIAFSEDKRGLHDRLAETKVVRHR